MFTEHGCADLVHLDEQTWCTSVLCEGRWFQFLSGHKVTELICYNSHPEYVSSRILITDRPTYQRRTMLVALRKVNKAIVTSLTKVINYKIVCPFPQLHHELAVPSINYLTLTNLMVKLLIRTCLFGNTTTVSQCHQSTTSDYHILKKQLSSSCVKHM